MLRAALFSIVLTLAAGQNAALLCLVWCGSLATSDCHHRDSGSTSASVASDTSCDHVAPGVSAFLKEDGSRTASAPDGDHAIEVPRYHLRHLTTDARPGHEPGHERSLANRPLSTALRI